MLEELRLKLQAHYHHICREKGWIDEEYNLLWPEDTEGRIAMSRGLFGLELISRLDGEYQDWQERANHINRPLKHANGQLDLNDKKWRDGLATMSEEQRAFVLEIIGDGIDTALYHFAIIIDRFEHGQLTLTNAVQDEKGKIKFTVPIFPHGSTEMLFEHHDWKNEYSLPEEP